jgi:CHAT domain-containing protein
LAGTRLVVLSACVTGLGEIHPSEGTLGLRRSFTIAGAEALLVSLWNVPDRATKTLMLKVYRLLGQGLAPAAALHRAQAEMRRWNRNPYFWGAFVTYGGVPLISVPKVSR